MLSVLAKFQILREKVEPDKAVSISFPSKPVESTNAAGISSVLKQSDSSAAIYVASVIDLQVTGGIDLVMLQAAMEQD